MDPDNLTAKCSRATYRDLLTDIQEAMPAAVGARHAAAQYLKVQQLSLSFACLCESSNSVSELHSGMLLLPKCHERM